MQAASKRLGELLIEDALISESVLKDLLAVQKSIGARLGELLTGMRLIHPLKLYEILAHQRQVPFVDLEKRPCEPELLDYEQLSFYRSRSCIPWQRRYGRLYVACTNIQQYTKQLLESYFGEPVELVYCTPRDHRHALERQFSSQMEHDTRTRIRRELPHYSAYYTASPQQRLALFGMLASIAALFMLWPAAMLATCIVAVNLLYLATVAFKWLLFRQPPAPKPFIRRAPHDSDLPVYSLLIPLYKEEKVIPRLLDAIRALDYPKHKLDVKLIVEEDDLRTHQAIERYRPEPYFDIIRVPLSSPRTKPKACSYALQFAKGDFVTIYDAEDRPEPEQLKKAVAAFRAAPDEVICLQARLNYFNWSENPLTRCFAIEYANLFDRLLPGLQALKLPIPLGGTSNHINLKRLRELKDWDPYNVTEDADLGMRLAMHGYQTQMLDSVTMEEAPISLMAWIKQRTRWIKGYMQTWLVYMRQPKALREGLGLRGTLGFHLFIGAPCLTFLLAPFLWVFSIIWAMGYIQQPAASWMFYLCIGSFAAGYISHVVFARSAARDWSWSGMERLVFFYPLYWLLHSFASLRALWQLIKRPHYWDKTQHGLSKISLKTLDTPLASGYKPDSI